MQPGDHQQVAIRPMALRPCFSTSLPFVKLIITKAKNKGATETKL